MKTNPHRYFDVLSLAPRLAPVVPDASALRNHRRVQSGMRAYFAMHKRDWMADLRASRPSNPRDRVN
jgi:hypothetical protein